MVKMVLFIKRSCSTFPLNDKHRKKYNNNDNKQQQEEQEQQQHKCYNIAYLNKSDHKMTFDIITNSMYLVTCKYQIVLQIYVFNRIPPLKCYSN